MDTVNVLFVSYEVAPLFKQGGLGDVAGSLPKQLATLGVNIALIMPHYQIIDHHKWNISSPVYKTFLPFANRNELITLSKTVLPGTDVTVYLIGNKTYLSSLTLPENIQPSSQFAFFSKAVVHITREFKSITGKRVDLIHLNDWHSALVPLLIKNTFHDGVKLNLPKTLLTIHNFRYEMHAPLDVLYRLGISPHADRVVTWDAKNKTIDFLKEGIIHADFVSTVSPSYREEIIDTRLNGKLAQITKAKEGRVVGILNGIDTDVWNPKLDPFIQTHYPNGTDGVAASGHIEGKRINKIATQQLTGLPIGNDALFAFIGRLDPNQKGIDIIVESLEELLPKSQMQMIVLGVGNVVWEDRLATLSHKYREKLVYINRFDEALAHQVYAGADAIIVPSRYEPCGLVQMIAMRYGAIPLVRKVGGLADTVINGETGFVFSDYSGKELTHTIKHVITIYQSQPDTWRAMVKNGLAQDFSWKKSAKEYVKLYKRVISS